MEEQTPGSRLITIDAWIKYLESKQTILTNDVVQLPLHMLDEDFDEEQEMAKYTRRTRLKTDVESLTKVRQVCMFHCLLFDTQKKTIYRLNTNHAIIIVIISD